MDPARSIPVVTERADGEPTRGELVGEARQRAERGLPRPGVRLAVGVVQQHRAAVDVPARDVGDDGVGRRLASPVATPRGPQHRGHAETVRGAQRRRTTRMPNGGRNHCGSVPVAAATRVVRRWRCRRPRGAGCASQHVAVQSPCTAISCPAAATVAHDAGPAADIVTEHEERGAPAQLVEHREELGRRVRIGTVVERQRDVSRAADADETRA